MCTNNNMLFFKQLSVKVTYVLGNPQPSILNHQNNFDD